MKLPETLLRSLRVAAAGSAIAVVAAACGSDLPPKPTAHPAHALAEHPGHPPQPQPPLPAADAGVLEEEPWDCLGCGMG